MVNSFRELSADCFPVVSPVFAAESSFPPADVPFPLEVPLLLLLLLPESVFVLAAFFTVTDALLPDMESISSLESKITPSLAKTETEEFPALTAFNVTV